jgi:hypothetical protein
MLEVTLRLLANPYTGSLYLKYQEALLQELLCTTIGYLGTSSGGPGEEYSQRELRALREARELLRQELDACTSAP